MTDLVTSISTLTRSQAHLLRHRRQQPRLHSRLPQQQRFTPTPTATATATATPTQPPPSPTAISHGYIHAYPTATFTPTRQLPRCNSDATQAPPSPTPTATATATFTPTPQLRLLRLRQLRQRQHQHRVTTRTPRPTPSLGRARLRHRARNWFESLSKSQLYLFRHCWQKYDDNCEYCGFTRGSTMRSTVACHAEALAKTGARHENYYNRNAISFPCSLCLHQTFPARRILFLRCEIANGRNYGHCQPDPLMPNT